MFSVSLPKSHQLLDLGEIKQSEVCPQNIHSNDGGVTSDHRPLELPSCSLGEVFLSSCKGSWVWMGLQWEGIFLGESVVIVKEKEILEDRKLQENEMSNLLFAQRFSGEKYF